MPRARVAREETDSTDAQAGGASKRKKVDNNGDEEWSNWYMYLTCRVNDVDKVVEMGVKMDVRMKKQKF